MAAMFTLSFARDAVIHMPLAAQTLEEAKKEVDEKYPNPMPVPRIIRGLHEKYTIYAIKKAKSTKWSDK